MAGLSFLNYVKADAHGLEDEGSVRTVSGFLAQGIW